MNSASLKKVYGVKTNSELLLLILEELNEYTIEKTSLDTFKVTIVVLDIDGPKEYEYRGTSLLELLCQAIHEQECGPLN